MQIQEFGIEYLYYRGNDENGAYIFATYKNNRTAIKLEDFYNSSLLCENPITKYFFFQGKIITEFVISNQH